MDQRRAWGQPLVSVAIYVEGGGDSKALKSQCRQAFHSLMTSAGFNRRPKVVACGPRNAAYDRFKMALVSSGDYSILLVDSEELVVPAHQPPVNSAGAWQHLYVRDSWARPTGAQDDQAQLMVTTMETWLLADRKTFVGHFPRISESSLPPDSSLEDRSKTDVEAAIDAATQHSSKGRYKKGRDSFDLLSKTDPNELKSKLPHFQRFIDTLDAHS